jgi:general stress protein YciG
MPLKRQTTANGKCQAKTKAGRQCAAPAVRGSALCALHSDPNRAAELGRKGGARNRKVYDNDVRNVSVPESAGDVKRMLAETMADIRAERMDPKLGSTLGYLGMALLRAFEVAELERRLEQMEQRHELEELEESWNKRSARSPLRRTASAFRPTNFPCWSCEPRERQPKQSCARFTADASGTWHRVSTVQYADQGISIQRGGVGARRSASRRWTPVSRPTAGRPRR